jgi:hypothetical protein
MYPDNAKNKKTITLTMINIIFTSFLFQNIYLEVTRRGIKVVAG